MKKVNNSEIDSTLFITLLKALTSKITVLVGYPSKKFIRLIFLINFIEGYPTKTVILDVNALSKVMNKVESISELLTFFTNSPLEKIKTN